jgi:hypothetical protein
MATVLRSTVRVQPKGTGPVVRPKAGGAKAASPFDASLPTEYEEPSDEFNDYAILIHGPKKVGKTTLALQGGNVFVLQLDPARKGLKRKERVIQNWNHFIAILKNLELAAKSGKPFPYDRVVLDGVQPLYQYCYDWCADKQGFDDPGEVGYGKGWKFIEKTFSDAVLRFLKLPCGRWFLTHSEWKEVPTRYGNVMKLVPNLSKQSDGVLNARVDAWFAYDYVGEQRVLVIEGNEWVGAGHSMDDAGYEHFRTPQKRLRVKEISMGGTPAEGFANLLKGFNNQLTAVKVGEGVQQAPAPVKAFGKRK